MKKVHWFIVILIALFTAGSVSAQDLQATNQALELEINILKLQATKQALEAEVGQQNEPQPSEPIEDASGGMMNWGSQKLPLCSHTDAFQQRFGSDQSAKLSGVGTTAYPARSSSDLGQTENKPNNKNLCGKLGSV